MKKKHIVIVGSAAAFLFLAWALVRALQWHRVDSYGFGQACPITRSEVAKRSMDYPVLPYIWEHALRGGGKMLFYGSRHTRDPQDVQVGDITRRWEAFRPTVALVEGFVGRLSPIGMHPVSEFGEMGHAYRLGLRDGVPVYSWEIPVAQDVAILQDEFSPRQIATYYILRPYFGQQKFGRPDSPEDFVREYVRERTTIAGLENTFRSVQELDAFWQESFPGGPDWRAVDDQGPLPGYLGDIFGATNLSRDWYAACAIYAAMQRGEHVFIIGGASHAARLEHILKAYQ